MNYIRKDKNGIYYLTFDEDTEPPEWITHAPDGKYYFLLNGYTRALFKRDMVPLLKAKRLTASDSNDPLFLKKLIEEIKDFSQREIMAYGGGIPPRDAPPGFTLMRHQEFAVDLGMTFPRYCFYLGTGTGKTLIAITLLRTMIHDVKRRILIVTPKSVTQQYMDAINMHGSTCMMGNVDVINFEKLVGMPFEEYENYQALIVDEAHRAKNFMSQANIVLRRIAEHCRYVWLFTGTPQDKSRHEILPQLAILDPRVMPLKGKTYDRYFRLNDYYVPTSEKKEFSDELTWIISQYSWGIKTEDAIELVPEECIKVMCPKPPEIYYRLLRDRIVQVPSRNFTVIADNKAVLRAKLREICAGHLTGTYEIDGEPPSTQTIRVENHKIAKLLEAINTYQHAIIFTEFIEDQAIIEYCLSQYTRFKYGILDTKTKKGRAVIDQFKSGDIEFLVMNSKSGGTGLDLSCTHTEIFYTLPESFIVFSQAKARIRRFGQTEPCTYVFLLEEDSIEIQQYEALQKKKSFDNKLFKIYK